MLNDSKKEVIKLRKLEFITDQQQGRYLWTDESVPSPHRRPSWWHGG